MTTTGRDLRTMRIAELQRVYRLDFSRAQQLRADLDALLVSEDRASEDHVRQVIAEAKAHVDPQDVEQLADRLAASAGIASSSKASGSAQSAAPFSSSSSCGETQA